jgi:hypothetical protein
MILVIVFCALLMSVTMFGEMARALLRPQSCPALGPTEQGEDWPSRPIPVWP